MAKEVPVREAVTVSVALIVWLPEVFSVAEKDPVPFASFESAGSTALASELEKWTVPAYVVAVLLKESSAVTVKLNGVPVLVVAGAAETESADAAAGPTGIAPEVPLMEPVAVMVWLPAVFSVIDAVPVPLVMAALAGSTAWASELVKFTVSEKVGTTLLLTSSAVTVMVNAVPAVGEGVADVTEK
jgi:hypothetical protein